MLAKNENDSAKINDILPHTADAELADNTENNEEVQPVNIFNVVNFH